MTRNYNKKTFKELTQEINEVHKELAFQYEEKAHRAAELLIANKELIYQNEEKAHRAAELLIANKELIYQNEEKAKRAEELIKLTDNSLFIEHQKFEKTLISIGDGVISIDNNRNILFINTVAEKLTGWLKEEAYGQPIYMVFNIINEFTRHRDEDIIGKVILTKTINNLANHTILIAKDFSEKLIEDSVAPILNKNHSIAGAVIVFRDYTEKWERLKKIEYMNYHDDLTGLYNRRFFEEELSRLDNIRNLPLTIIMGDLNGLKLINDSFGHVTGDEMLKVCSKLIKEACREDEIIGRIGGDEFAILLPKTNQIQAEDLINRIKSSFSNIKVVGVDVSISLGFGCKVVPKQDISEILKASEDSMYRNKLFEKTSLHSKTVDVISKTLFEKNERELLHSKRVSHLCELLATKMKFSKDKVAMMKTAGLMHDIGKIAIAENILNKTGRLTTSEYDAIKKHSEIGYRILSTVSEFSELSTFVLQHHEKWDGSGYPQGLKGEGIKLESRIITLADAYDAITNYRTYYHILKKDEAIQEIKRCLGTQFDPIVGKEFIDMLSTNDDI